MKRTALGPGALSLARGSTFPPRSEPLRRTASKPRRSFTPASTPQREKVAGHGSIVSGESPCDPAHLWPRALGGCDDPLCVIPLTRAEHRAFDDGRLDILGALISAGCWAEMAHAVEVHHVDPISLVQRCTGERYAPERSPT